MGEKWSEARKVEVAAKKIEARDREILGPLFADQVERVDRRELMMLRRQGAAKGAEHMHSHLTDEAVALAMLEVSALEALARQHLPGDVVDRLRAYMFRVYPAVGHWLTFWLDVLVGRKRIPCSITLQRDPSRITQWNHDGRYMVEGDLQPPADWKAPFGEEWRATYFWRRCDDCKRWHTPGQIECYEEYPCKENDNVFNVWLY